MKPFVDAIGLFVRDVGAMVSFYRDVFGFTTDWAGTDNAELYSKNVRLIMYPRAAFEKMVSSAFDYPKGLNGTMEIAFACENFAAVDAEFARVTASGATPLLPPTTEPWGQRTCYVSDPEGNLIEIGSFKAS